MGIKVAAYVRVSTEAQGERNSPKGQRDALAAWAKANDIEIVSWHEDHGTSGEVSPLQRQAVLDAVQSCKERDAAGIAVDIADRWTRGGLKDGVLSRAALANEHRLTLYVADLPFGLDQLVADIVLAIRDAMAAEWLRNHKEHVKRGSRDAKKQGWPNGRPGRPAKPALTPAELDEALTVLDNDGGIERAALAISKMRGMEDAIKHEVRMARRVSPEWLRRRLREAATKNQRVSVTLARRKTLRNHPKAEVGCHD